MKKSIIILFVFLLIIMYQSAIYSQWVPVSEVNGPTVVYSLVSNGNYLFAGTRYGPGSQWKGVYLTSNNGSNWSHTFNSYEVWSLAVNNGNIFAGTLGSGVFISTNNGVNWTQTSPISQNLTSSLASNGNYLYAGGSGGLYITSNSGLNWIQTLNFVYSVSSLLSFGTNVLAGCSNDSGIYLSTNNGLNWINTFHPSNGQGINSLAINENYIFAASSEIYGGLYKSSNNGLNWIQTSFNNTEPINSVACFGNNVFLGVFLQGIYISNDNGITWTQRNEGFPTVQIVTSFCFLNNFVFIGSDAGGVYRRPLSELVGLQNLTNETPNKYKLSQNYPNPFNPVTKIKFDTPPQPSPKGREQWVRLIVYDILGREIAALVNEQLKPGTYVVEWDASNYPSGVYLYKLITADASASLSIKYTEIKKMVLIK